jgi:hypothetical protein
VPRSDRNTCAREEVMPFVITLASAPTWGNALKNGPGLTRCFVWPATTKATP